MMGYGPGAGATGWGPGAAGDCPLGQAAQGESLTIEGVTTHLERRLAVMGNDRLMVGEVTEQGEDVIVGEIVTKDGSLVERLAFDRDTGRVARVK